MAALDASGVDNSRARLHLLLGIGNAAWHAGRPDAARDAFDAAVDIAERVGEIELLTQAVLGWASPPEDSLGWDTASSERLASVAARWPAEDHPLRARILGRLAVTLGDQGRDEEADRTFAEAESIARRVADVDTLAFVLRAWLRATLIHSDVLARRRAAAAELVVIGRTTTDLETEAWGHRWQATCGIEAGDVDAVDAAIDELERLSTTLRQPFHEWGWVIRRAGRLTMSGRLDEAEALWGRAMELAMALGSPYLLGTTPLLFFVIRWWQGRLLELEPAVESFVEGHPEHWQVLAVLYAETGRIAEARSLLGEARDPGGSGDDSGTARRSLLDLAEIAEVIAVVGDGERAAPLLSRLEPYADRFAVLPPGLTVVNSMRNPIGQLAGTLGDRAEPHRDRCRNPRTGCPARRRVVDRARLRDGRCGAPGRRAAAPPVAELRVHETQDPRVRTGATVTRSIVCRGPVIGDNG